jgi:hypothetical protein
MRRDFEGEGPARCVRGRRLYVEERVSVWDSGMRDVTSEGSAARARENVVAANWLAVATTQSDL